MDVAAHCSGGGLTEFSALRASALYVFLFLTEFVADTTFHIFFTPHHMVLKAHVGLLDEQLVSFTPFTVFQPVPLRRESTPHCSCINRWSVNQTCLLLAMWTSTAAANSTCFPLSAKSEWEWAWNDLTPSKEQIPDQRIPDCTPIPGGEQRIWIRTAQIEELYRTEKKSLVSRRLCQPCWKSAAIDCQLILFCTSGPYVSDCEPLHHWYLIDFVFS